VATILAVDDSASMRQMVGFTLKSAGHDVIEACDGQEALICSDAISAGARR
jgi:two-component system chemotaxis response regulator CheY